MKLLVAICVCRCWIRLIMKTQLQQRQWNGSKVIMATTMMEWEQVDYNNDNGVLITIVVVIEC